MDGAKVSRASEPSKRILYFFLGETAPTQPAEIVPPISSPYLCSEYWNLAYPPPFQSSSAHPTGTKKQFNWTERSISFWSFWVQRYLPFLRSLTEQNCLLWAQKFPATEETFASLLNSEALSDSSEPRYFFAFGHFFGCSNAWIGAFS